MPNIKVLKDRCKGCERCKEDCPMEIIHMSKELNTKGYFYATVPDSSKCIGCATCGMTCPDLAIEVQANGARYCFFDY
jgi:2-oxoglutarate ferredoxin oxidoreductase subunit delta